MTSSSRNPNAKTNRDPSTAGFMSILPGLGQIYNGETRKGYLFLGAGAINFAIFIFLVFNSQILGAIGSFGQSFNIAPNKQLIGSMIQMSMGSPVSLVLMGLFISFIAYSMRDAYDHAARLQRKHIYADAVMEFPEATSGSYLMHACLMATCLILAFFFLIPPPPRVQVTDIEFIQNQEEAKKERKYKKKAEKHSEDRGKHNPEKKVTPPSPAPKAAAQPQKQATPQPQKQPSPQPQKQPSPQPMKQPSPQPKPSPAPSPAPAPRPEPRPSPTPSPTPRPSPSPRPAPSPTPRPMANITPSPSPSPTPSPSPAKMPFAMPNPFAAPVSSPKSAPSPVAAPITMGKVGAPQAAAPRMAMASSNAGSAPAMINSSSLGTSGGGGKHGPTPVFAGGGGGGPKSQQGGGEPGPSVAPSRAGGGRPGGTEGGGNPFAAGPVVPRAGGGGSPGSEGGKSGSPGQGGKEGHDGNPPPGSKPGRNSMGAEKDIDFGPYMADLQRRIKRAWFPPKGNESKRVVVVFKVHSNGTMSNLRLVTSSGAAIADQAALKAVENAAPFRPLPDGAPSDVDIQFTFDYNVFAGGGVGKLRRF